MLSDLAQTTGKTDEHLPRLATTAREAVAALDEIVWAVNPRHDNLASLLEYLSHQTVELLQSAGLRCRLDFPKEVPPRDLPTDFRYHFFLIVREAVNNAVKHAQAREIRLSVELTDAELRATVADDGQGFAESPATAGSSGLANLRTRAADLGGECRIESQPGAGTTVTVRLPWPPENPRSELQNQKS
jgi:signal transduction histidine kinase